MNAARKSVHVSVHALSRDDLSPARTLAVTLQPMSRRMHADEAGSSLTIVFSSWKNYKLRVLYRLTWDPPLPERHGRPGFPCVRQIEPETRSRECRIRALSAGSINRQAGAPGSWRILLAGEA